MESCYGGMSTRLKQHAVTEFLSAENVMPAEIHRRLQAVCGENTVKPPSRKNCRLDPHQTGPYYTGAPLQEHALCRSQLPFLVGAYLT